MPPATIRFLTGLLLPLAGLIAFAVYPAHAQNTDLGISSGTKPAPVQQAAPQDRSERFDDWTVRCVSQAAGKSDARHCEVAQVVSVEQDGQSLDLLNLAVSPADDKAGKVKWALVALTPLDVDLVSGFGLLAGTGKPEAFRYRNCNHLGCFAVIPLSPALTAALRKGDGKNQKAAAFFRLTSGKVVKAVFSVKGFATALDRLASGKDLPGAVDAEPKP